MIINELKMESRPVLADGFRLYWDEEEGSYVLLYPEAMIVLDEDYSKVLQCCSGTRTIAEIIQEMEQIVPQNNKDQLVHRQLEQAINNGWVTIK